MTKAWIKHENTIHDLYKVQGKTLEETMKIMKAHYGFDASTRAYRAKFKKWGWTKYNKQKRSDHRSQARPPLVNSPYEAPLMTPGPSSDGVSGTGGALSARTMISPTSSHTFRTPDVGYPSLRPDGYRNISHPLSPISFEPAYTNHQLNLQDTLQPQRHSFQNPQLLASPPPQRNGGTFHWQGYNQQAQQQQHFQQQHAPYRPILPALDQDRQQQSLHVDTCHTQVSFLSALLTPDSPTSSSMSSIQRSQLITQNVYQLRGLGRLNERLFNLNGQRLSPLELFVQSSAPGISPGSHASAEEIHEFCRVCTIFVQMDADTTRIVPRGFAQTILLASEPRNLVLSQQQQQDGGPSFPSWARVWISACQQGLGRNFVSIDQHLDVLSWWLGEHVVHRNLRELLFESSSPEPDLRPESTTGQQINHNIWDQ